MSNNKSRRLMRQSGTHTVYGPPPPLKEAQQIQMANMIYKLTGKMESWHDLNDKVLSIVELYKRDPRLVDGIINSSGLKKEVAFALLEYLSLPNGNRESLIYELFMAEKT